LDGFFPFPGFVVFFSTPIRINGREGGKEEIEKEGKGTEKDGKEIEKVGKEIEMEENAKDVIGMEENVKGGREETIEMEEKIEKAMQRELLHFINVLLSAAAQFLVKRTKKEIKNPFMKIAR